MWINHVRVLIILGFVIGLAACTPAPAPDLTGWQMLYTRPDWQGGVTVDLRAVGDVMLARNVATLAERRGPETLFADTAGLLAGDLTIGNLESPLTERPAEARPGPYRLLAPSALAPTLRDAGFDALGLANNHGLDAGPAGLANTLETLRAVGIAPIGAAASERTAFEPVVLNAAGLRVAVLAFNDVLDPADGPVALAAPDDRAWRSPDFARCPPPADSCPSGRAWLSATALDAVATARTEADVVVVLAHWGVEYAHTPSARQHAWAARLVAAGADLVLGAHPHVLQPAEAVSAGGRTGFVAYSLGNFVFDGPDDPDLSSGAILRVLLDSDGVALVAAAPIATAGGHTRPLDPASDPARAALASLGVAVSNLLTPSPAQATASPQAVVGTEPAAQGDPLPYPIPGMPTVATWVWKDGVATSGSPELLRLAAESLPLPAPSTRVPADLRGDGTQLWAELDATGMVTLRDGEASDAPVVWRNEDPAWRFTRVVAGDPNDDGRVELLLLLWQPDATGQLRTQPYVLGWRGGSYKIIWGGSPTTMPIQDVAVADLDGDGRSELVVLEGGTMPGDTGEYISVWHWHGWGFQLEWRSPPGQWGALALVDLDGDGREEIVAQALSSAMAGRESARGGYSRSDQLIG